MRGEGGHYLSETKFTNIEFVDERGLIPKLEKILTKDEMESAKKILTGFSLVRSSIIEAREFSNEQVVGFIDRFHLTVGI
jgi:hypothetical protein